MSGYYSTTDGRHIFRLLDGERTNGYSGPYVVIDPEDREAVERLYRTLVSLTTLADADRVQAALREYANPKPPKPDEPQGLGAVVEDENGTKWVRHDSVPIHRRWLNTDDCDTRYRSWDEIDPARVLSPGVEVDQ